MRKERISGFWPDFIMLFFIPLPPDILEQGLSRVFVPIPSPLGMLSSFMYPVHPIAKLDFTKHSPHSAIFVWPLIMCHL